MFLLTICIQSLLSSQLLIWCIHGYTWMRTLSHRGKNIFEFLVFICAMVVFSCKDLFFTLGLHVRAKSLQSCLTLCNPMDCSLPVSTVHGILQARILEWVALFQGIFPTQVWLLLISVRKVESDLWKPYIYRSKEMGRRMKKKSPKHRKNSSETFDFSSRPLGFIHPGNHRWVFWPDILILDKPVVSKQGLHIRMYRSLDLTPGDNSSFGSGFFFPETLCFRNSLQ